MIRIDRQRTAADLLPAINRLFDLSAQKIRSIEDSWRPEDGSPVFTVDGVYRSRGWTEWTQGFQFGAPLLQFDATCDREFLELGRSHTLERMAPHLTHVGVHDHGFNNVSTYGNLWRLAREGKFEAEAWELRFYALALKVTGAVQARRWTSIPGGGFIYSFNGAHSLFVDTIRTLRALALSHVLGHRLFEEQDVQVNLLERLLQHARATAEFSVYFGKRPRHVRCARPNGAREPVQCGQRNVSRSELAAGLLAVLDVDARPRMGDARVCRAVGVSADDRSRGTGATIHVVKASADNGTGTGTGTNDPLYEAAVATCDFYIDHAAAADGVPYWDTGAPGLAALGDWGDRAADPFNDHEPVDSSAAAIAAQGLLRLARVAAARGADGKRYEQAGLRVLETLIDETGPYLSRDDRHQGLLLHSIYHRPNGWDHVPAGSRIPRGESSMWGDYHLREAALYVKRIAEGAPYFTFFGS